MTTPPSDRTPFRFIVRAPDAVLFDWDSTLADTDKALHVAMQQLFLDFGKTLPDAQWGVEEWRKSHEDFYAIHFPNTAVEEIKTAFVEHFKANHLRHISLLPDAEKTLSALAEKSIPMAIVSNKGEALLLPEIHHLGVAHYFDVITGATNGRNKKPSPDPIVETLKKLGIGLGNIWLAGDHLDDMDAGRSDGIQRICIGSRHKNTVENHFIGSDPLGTILYAENHRELTDIIQRIPERQAKRGV